MIRDELFSMREDVFADFQHKTLPTLSRESILGVRTPRLRAMAKEMKNTPEAEAFLAALPHAYFEENQLHAFLIEQEKDFDRCIALVNSFLLYVDNWATCDQLAPKALGRDLTRLEKAAFAWLDDAHPYTIRFGVNTLMRWFLADAFDARYLQRVAQIRSEEYYVNMGAAWYFATALTYRYDETLPYIEGKKLAPWTHNKAIQKAIESLQIPPERKAYLRSLKERSGKNVCRHKTGNI